jgi:diguanylate cyclase (GGDEF)-like protein
MNRLASLFHKIPAYIIVAIAYAFYLVILAIYHNRAEVGIASLAVLPVIAGSWYFGIRGGLLLAILSILANIVILTITGQLHETSIFNLNNDLRIFILILIAVVFGRLSTVTSERREALLKLENLEKGYQERTKFLELLNKITGNALEADNLESTFNILVKQFAKLFEAQDCFFARWDDANAVTIPITAYGSLSDVYPFMRFEPGERTLTASLMETGHSIAISDVENSPHISSKVASLFHSNSMLGLPLIVQGRKLGALILGYNKSRSFAEDEISRAETAANQIALVLSKAQILEEERKQVRQLTALHDVALTSIQVDNEDQLIERVTRIIGKNLFPDNFGILLVDEQHGILRPHPSYHFSSLERQDLTDIQLGEGVTGQVATTGQPQRIGNVNRARNYLNFDRGTCSELCVPIKIKEHVLGVINAESAKRDAFTMDDERLLVTLAGQLATTIEQLRTSQAERHWLDQLAHSNELIYSLAHITTHIQKALSPDEITQVLGAELNKIDLTCLTASYDESREVFTINSTSIGLDVLDRLEKGIGFPLIHQTFSLDQVNSILNGGDLSQPAVVSQIDDEIQILFPQRRKGNIPNIFEQAGINTEVELMRLPLMFEEHLLGILWIWGRGIVQADLPVMSIFAKQIGSSLERARLFQEVQSLAFTDPLTGLHNRRSIFELSRVEFSRAHRLNRPICCMMLDLDHFKEINDSYGHQAGDDVLQEFAKRCKSSIREMDLIGRYGGEELIIILPETNLITALQIAERMCESIAELPITILNGEINATVSVGVAAKDENTAQLETLIARADQAMYIAKHKGRNRVALSK